MTDTNQDFPLEKGRTSAPKKRSKGWGHESEFTRQLREKSLDSIITTGCGICGVSVRRSARDGIAWFKRHQQTAKHKRLAPKITPSRDSAKRKKK